MVKRGCEGQSPNRTEQELFENRAFVQNRQQNFRQLGFLRKTTKDNRCVDLDRFVEELKMTSFIIDNHRLPPF